MIFLKWFRRIRSYKNLFLQSIFQSIRSELGLILHWNPEKAMARVAYNTVQTFQDTMPYAQSGVTNTQKNCILSQNKPLPCNCSNTYALTTYKKSPDLYDNAF